MFNNAASNFTSSKFEIERLIMARSGMFGDQFHRPYQTTATQHVVNEVEQLYRQQGGNSQAINGGMFANVAGHFLKPMAQPETNLSIYIPHGWGTERFMFMMFVKVYHDMGHWIDLVQGYTDIADVSLQSQQLNPDTLFVVNSITRIANVRSHTMHGVVNTQRVTDSLHVISNMQGFDLQSYRDPNVDNHQSLRPADIYAKIQTNNQMPGLDFVDMRTQNGRAPKQSRRTNSLATDYMSTVMKSWATAQNRSMYDHEDGIGNDEIYASAMANALEPGLNMNPIIRAIANNRGLPPSEQFSIGDLYKLDPSLRGDQQRMVLLNASQPTMVNGALTAGNSAYWHVPDTVTQAAAILSNGLPALLIFCGLRAVRASFTNHVIPGQPPAFQVHFTQGFDGLTEVPATHKFVNRVIDELLSQISMNNNIGYNITIDTDLMFATSLSIQLDTQPEMVFNSPTFADALLTPVITSSEELPTAIAQDFEHLLDATVQRNTRLEDVMTFNPSMSSI